MHKSSMQRANSKARGCRYQGDGFACCNQRRLSLGKTIILTLNPDFPLIIAILGLDKRSWEIRKNNYSTL